MLQQPIVSIVIPCYNATSTLSATLQSIQESKYSELDIIVVDDGSTETVEHIVQNFADSRFRYFWKTNQGPGLARNFGINHAKGEYIFFLDSDDQIYPDSITNLLQYAIENNLDVVSGVTVRKEFDTGKEGEWFRNLYTEKTINTKKQRLKLFHDTLTTNKLYRVATLKEKDIYFEEGLYEDKLFTAKLYAKIDNIGLIDDRVYIWFIYGKDTSITMNKVLANFKERQVAIDKLWQYLPEIRKAYQIAFYMNHDLLIYLREFYVYSDEDKNEIEPNEEIAEEVKPVSEKTKYGKSVFGKSAYGKPKTNNNSINNNNLNNIYKDRQTNNISNTICKENDMSVNKNKIYEKVDDLLNGLVGSKDISKIQKLLEDGYSDELLCYTLDLAKEIKKDCNNSEIYRYLIGIWNNLKINNIKTLSDFKENEKQREVKRYESNRFCNAVTVRTGENKENKYAYLDSI